MTVTLSPSPRVMSPSDSGTSVHVPRCSHRPIGTLVARTDHRTTRAQGYSIGSFSSAGVHLGQRSRGAGTLRPSAAYSTTDSRQDQASDTALRVAHDRWSHRALPPPSASASWTCVHKERCRKIPAHGHEVTPLTPLDGDSGLEIRHGALLASLYTQAWHGVATAPLRR